MRSPARSLIFINAAHALVHYAVLIYPTAVIAIGIELRMSYEQLIPLASGCFVAFGLLSLPAGWLADRLGRPLLLTLYFVGLGIICEAQGKPVGKAMNVQVLKERTVTIAIRPVQVPGANGALAFHAKAAFDPDKLTEQMNAIYRPQANLSFN